MFFGYEINHSCLILVLFQIVEFQRVAKVTMAKLFYPEVSAQELREVVGYLEMTCGRICF